MSFEKEIKMGMMSLFSTPTLSLVNNDLLTNRIFSTIELAITTTLSFLNRLLYSFRGNYKNVHKLILSSSCQLKTNKDFNKM